MTEGRKNAGDRLGKADAALDAALDRLSAAEAMMLPPMPAALAERVLADARRATGITPVAGVGLAEERAPAADAERRARSIDRRAARTVDPGTMRGGEERRDAGRRDGGRRRSAARVTPGKSMMAALAASLAMGVFMGASGLAPPPPMPMGPRGGTEVTAALENDAALIVADAALFADDAPF
ncbi:MAG: hypothetical protein AAF899_11980 [Pseudomonadota bacterium]